MHAPPLVPLLENESTTTKIPRAALQRSRGCLGVPRDLISRIREGIVLAVGLGLVCHAWASRVLLLGIRDGAVGLGLVCHAWASRVLLLGTREGLVLAVGLRLVCHCLASRVLLLDLREGLVLAVSLSLVRYDLASRAHSRGEGSPQLWGALRRKHGRTANDVVQLAC